MKTKKNDINLRELFRQKLENAEVIPDPAIKSKLMRKVARKEFLRFNPARLNIYYIGGLLIAGISTVILLFPVPVKTQQTYSNPSVISTKADTGRFLEVAATKPFVKAKDFKTEIPDKLKVRNSDTGSKAKQASVILKTRDSRDNNFLPVNINKSLSKNGLLANGTNSGNKLQGGFKPDLLMIDPSVADGCAPLKLRFTCNVASIDSIRWTFGDGGYSNKKDPEWIFDVEGEYKVVLQAFSSDGKSISASAIVTVHPRPKAHFEISPEKAVIPENEIHFLNYSINAVQFKWDFGDGSTSEFFEPSHLYQKFSNYDIRLVVISDWGCSDSLIVSNAFSGSQYFIDFPNAFIPNTQGPAGGYYSMKSDEAAQVFHPSFSGVSEYQLKIFSKLGIPIFESSDINIGWDGYNKGQLCEPGVYIWKVRGKFRNGEPFIKMGDVTLLKN